MEDIFGQLDRAVRKVNRVRMQSDASTLAGVSAAFHGRSSPHAATNVSALVRQLTDDSINQLLWQVGELRRVTDSLMAVVAGELAQRAADDGGSSSGVVTAVANVAGVSRVDAAHHLAVGSMVIEAEQAIDVRDVVDSRELPLEVPQSWWESLAIAVVDHGLSVESALAIRQGLGEPAGQVTVERLADAAEMLAASGRGSGPDVLHSRACSERARLDGSVLLPALASTSAAV